MLSANHFAVLNQVRLSSDASQRTLARATQLSVGTVNSTVRTLQAQGLIDQGCLTDKGKLALEPYRVTNAVIMAAGMSTRFAPISYEKPKGLLKVKGEVLIERTIRQLQEAGITDITLVVGYKMEQFLYLEDTMGVKIVVNPVYAERNNNSTLKLVEDRLDNTYICSADNYFSDNVFEPYVYHAYYAAVFQEGPTDEWGLTVGAHDRITKVTPGKKDSWVMLGHAYFDRAFSQRFTAILDEVYDLDETKPKLWEAIYSDHIRELDMRIRRYEPGIIFEFDSMDDLRDFDPEFLVNIDSSIFDNICRVLRVSRSDLHGFQPITEGLTNLTFRFFAGDKEYAYRHPGVATKGILNRSAEAQAEVIAAELGLDSSFVHLDPDTGWKISQFIEVSEHFDYHNPHHVGLAMDCIRTLHTSGRAIDNVFDIYAEARKIIGLLFQGSSRKSSGVLDFPDFAILEAQAGALHDLTQADGVPLVLCHDDFYDPNILVVGDDLCLIDWEYSGM
ncbi:MAG: NTP transferase domain-containing protein, partial [Propionibacteriaceae bacterium]|nr:NTP transferase domain-containing protein [Propionibacteriaceae bacterium]